MSFDNARLITPPREEEEIYPYRRVWTSRLIEGFLLIIITIGLYGAALLGVQIPDALKTPLNFLLSLLPAILWLIFSQLSELRVPQPANHLLRVFILAGLLMAAIGLPLITFFFQPSSWLSEQDTFTRILAYTMTTGIVQVFVMYLAQRYTIWHHEYRRRTDAIAYAVAAALGSATVLNFYYVFDNPDVFNHIIALRVLHTTTISLIAGIFIGYGLVQTAFQRATALMLPLMTILASFIIGIGIALRSGIISGGLGLTGGATREYFGLAFSIVLLIAGMGFLFFLYRIADNRDKDQLRG